MNAARLVALAAVAALAAGPVPGNAADADNPGDGTTCGFGSTHDPLSERYTQFGLLFGGPFPNAHGVLRCTIQVGAHSTHAGDDATSVTATAPGGLVPPTPIWFLPRDMDAVYFCTQFTPDTGHVLYWGDSNDPAQPGHWSTSPDVSCGLAVDLSDPVTGSESYAGTPDRA